MGGAQSVRRELAAEAPPPRLRLRASCCGAIPRLSFKLLLLEALQIRAATSPVALGGSDAALGLPIFLRRN